MICGDLGRWANARHLTSQAARFLLSKQDAQYIVDSMEAQVDVRWFSIARACGVSLSDCGKHSRRICLPWISRLKRTKPFG